MSEESTTSDLLELGRRLFDAGRRAHVTRIETYDDVNEARAGAERLAEERG